MKIEGQNYKTIWFDKNLKNIKIIDQTKLPHEFIIKDLKTVKDAINAIKVMEVRGAPLIGATAAFGIVLAIKENNDLNFIKKSAEDLVKARPTAINLQWAVHRMNNKISMIKSENLFDVALNEAEALTRNAEIINAMGMMTNISNQWQPLNDAVGNHTKKAAKRASIVAAITKSIRMCIQMMTMAVGAVLVISNQMSAGGIIATSILYLLSSPHIFRVSTIFFP